MTKNNSCTHCCQLLLQGDEENLPTFTGPYEYELPTDMDYELNQEEIDDGWRIVRDTRRGGMSKVKIKLRLESGYLGEAGEKLRTWEVISQYAIASYDVMANPRYQKAIGGRLSVNDFLIARILQLTRYICFLVFCCCSS